MAVVNLDKYTREDFERALEEIDTEGAQVMYPKEMTDFVINFCENLSARVEGDSDESVLCGTMVYGMIIGLIAGEKKNLTFH